jgi:hypothetical protein
MKIINLLIALAICCTTFAQSELQWDRKFCVLDLPALSLGSDSTGFYILTKEKADDKADLFEKFSLDRKPLIEKKIDFSKG